MDLERAFKDALSSKDKRALCKAVKTLNKTMDLIDSLRTESVIKSTKKNNSIKKRATVVTAISSSSEDSCDNDSETVDCIGCTYNLDGFGGKHAWLEANLPSMTSTDIDTQDMTSSEI